MKLLSILIKENGYSCKTLTNTILENMGGDSRLVQSINALRVQLVQAAQGVYNEWEQDEEGYDEMYGGGGICDDVAEAMVNVVHSNTNFGAFHLYNESDCHTSIYIYDSTTKECYNVDISPYHYENGTAYTWKKIPDVQFIPNMVTINWVDYEDYVNGDVRGDLNESIDDTSEQEKQMYIDIISMNPDDPKYQRYKEILKRKFNVNFDDVYHDPKHMSDMDINNVKSQKDFNNFDNFMKYAGDISTKRGFISMNDYFDIHVENPIQTLQTLAKILGFEAIPKDYQESNRGGGDIAHAVGDAIYYTTHMSLYYVLHEMGHVYQHQTQYKGIAGNSAYSPTKYGTTNSGEAFAENFAIYFLNPTALQKWSEEIYAEMGRIISPLWKLAIRKYLN
jgi:hypothetical protein